jgi:hypothetical protein
MPVRDSSAAWAAIREEQAAKEKTEMLKVVGFVAVIIGVAFFVSQINRRRSSVRHRQSQLVSKALNIQQT